MQLDAIPLPCPLTNPSPTALSHDFSPSNTCLCTCADTRVRLSSAHLCPDCCRVVSPWPQLLHTKFGMARPVNNAPSFGLNEWVSPIFKISNVNFQFSKRPSAPPCPWSLWRDSWGIEKYMQRMLSSAREYTLTVSRPSPLHVPLQLTLHSPLLPSSLSDMT
jgi:hypothetical protein